jgi:hypothetical protein
MARRTAAASWHRSFEKMFLRQRDRHKSWLQTYTPLLAGFQGALGTWPCRNDCAADAKSLTVAFWYNIVVFWYLILLQMIFFHGLIGTINGVFKTIKSCCKSPRRFFAGNLVRINRCRTRRKNLTNAARSSKTSALVKSVFRWRREAQIILQLNSERKIKL